MQTKEARAESVRRYIAKKIKNDPSFIQKKKEYQDAWNRKRPKKGVKVLSEIVGNVYGMLTVLKNLNHIEITCYDNYLCQCSCGNTKIICRHTLTSKKPTISCGCLVKTHGQSKTKEWNTWSRMKGRCLNEKNAAYMNYGGRGIKVAASWVNSFSNFFLDMGLAPSRLHSLERMETDGNYEKSNCIWATDEIQANNKRNNKYIEYMGKSKTIGRWASFYNVKYLKMYHQIVTKKRTVDEALRRLGNTGDYVPTKKDNLR